MNQESFEKLIATYDFDLPKSLIAQSPVARRDESKLLAYNRATEVTNHSLFRSIGDYLPPESLIVFNETKVIPARITAYKETGGAVELLYISQSKNIFYMLASKQLLPGTILTIADNKKIKILKRVKKQYMVQPLFSATDLLPLLQTRGTMPLPPYIKDTGMTEEEIRQRYQTVFAKEEGSVAAPTASLHFTPELLHQLESGGHTLEYITLHVGLGTFAPLTPEHIESGKLHTEQFTISQKAADTINDARHISRPIVAVGTTAARALETAGANTTIQAGSTETDIFIQPGYNWNTVNHLITNFHVPKSSLLMLVASLTGRKKLLELYQEAIKNKYRFYSFGDAMLVL